MRLHEKFDAVKCRNIDPRTRRYLAPKRIVYTEGKVVNPAALLLDRTNQITQVFGENCQLINEPGQPHAKVVVDFGIEMAGSVRLMVWGANGPDGRANVRVRFGESVMEALTPLKVKNTTNDHVIRDSVYSIGLLSQTETNESGFRFACVELLDETANVTFKAIQGVMQYRDLDYIGSFECSDERLNTIWDTSAYTAHICMQEYLWDGIKRDRFVWMGDFHTEIQTIAAVFGEVDIVPNSLDIIRDETPHTKWMNNIGSYSIWWMLNHLDWYRANGNLEYLKEQEQYMKELLSFLMTTIDENGCEKMEGRRFLDWANDADPIAVHAGLQAMYKLAFDAGQVLFRIFGDDEFVAKCKEMSELVSRHIPDCNGSKQAGALMAISGLMDPKKVNEEIIAPGGAHGYSTFFGYYIMYAKWLAGDHEGALRDMKEYWGGMLDVGATSFWEDFRLEWLENAGRIDEIVPEGKVDIHGDYGAYCYKQFRHSLCHGWASGPCPYLTNFVLGVRYITPGKYEVKPDLAYLDWAKGTYPTPYGTISVSVTKNADGSLNTVIDAPEGVEIIR